MLLNELACQITLFFHQMTKQVLISTHLQYSTFNVHLYFEKKDPLTLATWLGKEQ